MCIDGNMVSLVWQIHSGRDNNLLGKINSGAPASIVMIQRHWMSACRNAIMTDVTERKFVRLSDEVGVEEAGVGDILYSCGDQPMCR